MTLFARIAKITFFSLIMIIVALFSLLIMKIEPWLAVITVPSIIWFAAYISFHQKRYVLGLLSPILTIYLVSMTVAFVDGAVRWTLGTAEIKSFGLPSDSFDNLDRETGVRRDSLGCVVFIESLPVLRAYNAGINLMGKVFGKMPGSYSGYYPYYPESAQAVREKYDAYFSTEKGYIYQFSYGNAESIDNRKVVYERNFSKNSFKLHRCDTHIKLTILKDRAVIMSCKNRYEEGKQHFDLYDGETGEWIALLEPTEKPTQPQ